MSELILINGSPRSGTTYLHRYLAWKFGKALFEPITTPQALGKVIKDREAVLRALKDHPLLASGSPYGVWWIYDKDKLKRYLSHIANYAVKEISLHMYLDEEFITSNWTPYHIIRHPGDVYLSYFGLMGRRGKLIEVSIKVLNKLAWLGLHPLSKLFPPWEFGKRLGPALWSTEQARAPKDYEDAFVILWTLTNYYAMKAVGKRLIVYNKKEDYLKLPGFEEFESKVEPIKIREYPQREKIAERFRKKANELGIGDMFEELMNLF